MSFIDLKFLIFFPVVILANFFTPVRFRWIVLLVASYAFYMSWKPEYGLILLGITAVDFFAGRCMGETENNKTRKTILLASLIANLGLLFVFKYFNFVFESIAAFLDAIGSGASMPVLNLLLPIGISFHIFQSLSYTIDVYLRRIQPVSHFGKFALYVSFFPQLVAGPIERPGTLLPQFFQDKRFDLALAHRGIKLMAWGFFKKLVIADNLAPLINAVYSSPENFTGPSILIATIFFAYQIYCDFSGYTDIARGTANVLGYELIANFDRPYASRSVGEFWRRWHMSLSHWFKDYVYVPLGGSRLGISKTVRNLMITFLLSGLWHGANWTYIVWGGLNGLYLVTESILFHISKNRTLVGKKPFYSGKSWSLLGTFILICITWIFFRAQSLSSAVLMIKKIPSGINEFFGSLSTVEGASQVLGMGISIKSAVIGVLGIIVLEFIDTLRSRGLFNKRFIRLSRPARIAAYAIFASIIIGAGSFGGAHQFIYFQF